MKPAPPGRPHHHPVTPPPFVPVSAAAVRAFADRFFIALRPLMDDLDTISATISHRPAAEWVVIDNEGWRLSFELSVHLTKPHVLIMLEGSRLGWSGTLASLTSRGAGSSRSIGTWSGAPAAVNAAEAAAAHFHAEVWSDRALCNWMRDRGKSKPTS
jgi:hypothetical protein